MAIMEKSSWTSSRTILLKNSNCSNFRNNLFLTFKLSFLFNFIHTIFKIVAIMFGLIFLQLDYDQQGVQNINGVLFLSICNSGFGTIFFVVNVIIMFI